METVDDFCSTTDNKCSLTYCIQHLINKYEFKLLEKLDSDNLVDIDYTNLQKIKDIAITLFNKSNKYYKMTKEKFNVAIESKIITPKMNYNRLYIIDMINNDSIVKNATHETTFDINAFIAFGMASDDEYYQVIYITKKYFQQYPTKDALKKLFKIFTKEVGVMLIKESDYNDEELNLRL